MKGVLAAFASIALLAWIAFHVMNRVWEGNELYWLLAAHATLVLILAVALTPSARFAIRGSRRLQANWTARGSMIGGIYARRLSIANFVPSWCGPERD